MTQLAMFPDWETDPHSGLAFCPACLAWQFNCAGRHTPGCELEAALPMAAQE